jgi:hypothetical protein
LVDWMVQYHDSSHISTVSILFMNQENHLPSTKDSVKFGSLILKQIK